MASTDFSLLATLREAYEASRAVRTFADLERVLERVATLVTDELGWARVVVFGHRQAWDRFDAVAASGLGAADHLGEVRTWDRLAPSLSPSNERRGVYVVRHDAVVAPMHDSAGEMAGFMVAEGTPSRYSPSDEEIDSLVAVASIGGAALDEARRATRADTHRAALEHLLAISAGLADARSAATVLDAVCAGIRDALGFERVVVELADDHGVVAPAAQAGWDVMPELPLTIGDMAELFVPEYEEHGCYLLERADALRVLGDAHHIAYESQRNGSGPWGWRHHWLIVPLRDPAGRLLGYIWPDDPNDCLVPDTQKLQALRLFADQAQSALEAARHYEQAVHLARHDSLTGLPNRRMLLDRLQHALHNSRRRHSTVAVLFIDLDRFKAVNDTHGHDVGDEVLRIAGARIDEALRPGDTVARLGGDEFVVLCEDVHDGSEALDIAQRLRAALRRPITVGGVTVQLNASVGIALPGSESEDAGALLRDADMAMYRAKDAGRDCAELASPSMRAGASARAQLERALDGALERDEMRIYWQPIVSLTDGRIVRLEALSRWVHPGLGWVSPLEFIPIAEETGFIVGLGRWVLEQACAQWEQWHEQHGPDTPGIAVNLSPRQLNDPELHELVAGLLARHRMPPGTLCVEITEGVLLEAGPATEHALAGLRSLGVELDLDDFGTGFSSLSSLERFHVDGLKIDRAFVAGRERDPRSGAIVEAVLLMARALGVRATAEGVETTEQLTWLTKVGCEHAQGFHFARPQPAAEVEALLAERLGARV